MKRYAFQGEQWTMPEQKKSALEMWNASLIHRQYFSHVLSAAKPSSSAGEVAIYGTYNCFEVDLAQVSPNFGKFTLFSVNKQITENAVSHQQIDDRSKIEIVEMVDYTGIGNRLEDMIDTSLSYDQMSDLIRGFQLGPVENGNPKQYDVVVSSCILSSIVNQLASVFGSLPKEHVGKLIKTIRDQHITQLLSHCKQGGKVLLYFSLMSAEMCPEIEKVKPEAFQALIADQLQKGIHYHGCSPLAIQLGLENDPEMFELIKDPRATMPWLWDAGAQRLAVMCIEFTKK